MRAQHARLRGLQRGIVVDTPLFHDLALRDNGALDAGHAAARTPDQQRHHKSQRAYCHKDQPDYVQVDACHFRLDRESQDGADGEKEDADTDTHGLRLHIRVPLLYGFARLPHRRDDPARYLQQFVTPRSAVNIPVSRARTVPRRRRLTALLYLALGNTGGPSRSCP
jgi:hypothetical protein